MCAKSETGVELLARLVKRTSIAKVDEKLFFEGLSMGDKILIYGEPSTCKSMLLHSLIATCTLPKKFGGLESAVILIETSHNDSVVDIAKIIRERLVKREVDVDAVVEQSLKRLFLFKTYSCDEMRLNFLLLNKILLSNYKISMVAVDTISEFYWQDVAKVGAIRKMDRYVQKLLEKLFKEIDKHKIVSVIVRQAYFQSKKSSALPNSLQYRIELRKESEHGNGVAIVSANNSVRNFHFSTGKGGIHWLYDKCGSVEKYEELVKEIREKNPEAEVNGFIGRQGSFEVSINGTNVYSKLATLAYPKFSAVSEAVSQVTSGELPRPVKEQQPITDCCLM